jgi:peptidyl-prolyl cis-trans isomerase C
MRPALVGGVIAAGVAHPAVAADPAPVTPPTQAEMAADFLTTVRRMADQLATTPDIVVAEIGGQTVTRGDVADAFRALPATDGNRPFDAVYRDVVQRLLGRKALVVRAREQGMDKDPQLLRRMAGASEAVLIEAFLEKAVSPAITDQLLHQTYDSEVAGKPGPDEVRGRVIMTYTETQANDVLAALAKGEDFADLARARSKDASAQAGGDIGFVRREVVSPEIAAVLFSLAPGQTTAFPVRASGAWFVIKVESRRQLPPPSFDSAQAGLRHELMRAAVPTTIKAAMVGLPVQDYGMTGKAAGGATPASH